MSQPNVVPMRGDAVREVTAAFERLKQAWQQERWPTAAAREDRLDRLVRLLQRERDTLAAAIAEDFGSRAPVETLSADVLMTLESARDARRSVRRWMQRRPAQPQWYLRPARAWVEPQPLGVVGIIAPWNYPVNLALGPLAAALAAGNRALVKPSELTPRTAELLQRLAREYFTPDEVAVVTGGPEVARALTALPLDHLLFTGSTQVGRLVAKACAENLVPTTLELGGKSPALMHPSYPVETFARKVAVGKLFNAGQTCIAPDYVLLPRGQEERFERAFTAAVRALVPDLHSRDVTSLASEKGYARVVALLEDARAKGARLVETLAGASAGDRRMAPVLVFEATDEMRVLQEELFGPILPVVPCDDLEQALGYVNARPRPLALYYFDDDARRVEQVLRATTSGGVSVNDTLLHFTQESLPFGGVGHSGMGRYHGLAGFETFSHLKGVFEQSRLAAAPRILSAPAAIARRALEVLIGGRTRRPGE